jgi:RNA polymerase primary sigma factor
VAQRIVTVGWATDEDLDDILFGIRGRFDPVDIRLNLSREIEAAGYFIKDDEPEGMWDPVTCVSDEELAEALMTTCIRNASLPGATSKVPGMRRANRLTRAVSEARRKVAMGLAENPSALSVIVYMVDRVIAGEVRSETVMSLDFEPDRATADSQLVIEAIDHIRALQDDVAEGSGRAIRRVADSILSLDLKIDFLHEVAVAMRDEADLATAASDLERSLAAYEEATVALELAFLPSCRRYAAQQANDAEDEEDLFQAQYFGLKRVVERYDPDRGTQFHAYLSAWLRQAVSRWRSDEGKIVRIPVHRREVLNRMIKARECIEERVLRPARAEEIADQTQLPLEEILKLLRHPNDAIPLEELDQISSEGIEQIPEEMIVRDVVGVIHEELGQLPERLSDVLRKRYGIGTDDEMTLEEIGQIYGVTRERIRQLEAKAFKYLEHPARIRFLSQAR